MKVLFVFRCATIVGILAFAAVASEARAVLAPPEVLIQFNGKKEDNPSSPAKVRIRATGFYDDTKKPKDSTREIRVWYRLKGTTTWYAMAVTVDAKSNLWAANKFDLAAGTYEVQPEIICGTARAVDTPREITIEGSEPEEENAVNDCGERLEICFRRLSLVVHVPIVSARDR